jgi:hypothetical protein
MNLQSVMFRRNRTRPNALIKRIAPCQTVHLMCLQAPAFAGTILVRWSQRARKVCGVKGALFGIETGDILGLIHQVFTDFPAGRNVQPNLRQSSRRSVVPVVSLRGHLSIDCCNEICCYVCFAPGHLARFCRASSRPRKIWRPKNPAPVQRWCIKRPQPTHRFFLARFPRPFHAKGLRDCHHCTLLPKSGQGGFQVDGQGAASAHAHGEQCWYSRHPS